MTEITKEEKTICLTLTEKLGQIELTNEQKSYLLGYAEGIRQSKDKTA